MVLHVAKDVTGLMGTGSLDPADSRVRNAMKSGSAEQVAALMNQSQCIRREDLCVLLDLLSSEPFRWEGNSGAMSFQVGSFVYGPMTGVRAGTQALSRKRHAQTPGPGLPEAC